MKKLFLIAMALVAVQVSFAQSILNRFHIGLKAGANYSNFSNAGFNTEGLVGYHGGLIVNFELNKNLSIQEEFLYSTQGAKLKDKTFGKDDLKLNYLSVPLVLKYHSNIGIYAEAGPQVGILASDVKDTPFDKFAAKIDAGVVAGLGYQFRSGPVKGLGIGARYYYGFMDVGKFNSSGIKPDFRNNMVQTSIFYIF